MEITRVQRWVASAMALTVAYVWALGMVLGALFVIDQNRRGDQVAVLVIASIVGLGAIVGVRIINELPWLTPWLVVGLLPTAAGLLALSQR